jgi:hypothetical protein
MSVLNTEILKWAEKDATASKYLDNHKLVELLYQKAMNISPVVRVMNNPNEIKLSELKALVPRTKVAFRGLVAEIQKDTYQGCSKCKKKVCQCGVSLVDVVVTRLLIGDETDMVWATGFGLDDTVHEKDVVDVVGAVKEWKNEKSVNIFEIKLAPKQEAPVAVVAPVKGSKEEKVNRLVSFVESSGSVQLPMFRTMVQGEGLQMSDVDKMVIVDVKSNAVFPMIPEGF